MGEDIESHEEEDIKEIEELTIIKCHHQKDAEKILHDLRDIENIRVNLSVVDDEEGGEIKSRFNDSDQEITQPIRQRDRRPPFFMEDYITDITFT